MSIWPRAIRRRNEMTMDNEKLVVCALSRDVFFGMRIRTVLQNLGYEMALCKNEDELVTAAPDAAIALVDFNQGVDWQALQPLIASTTPVIAFGAHTNVEGFRTAKSAGVRRVVSNGEFSRKLPALLTQYKRALPKDEPIVGEDM